MPLVVQRMNNRVALLACQPARRFAARGHPQCVHSLKQNTAVV